jgi:ABC-type transport system substrate-binding protein
MDLEKKDWAIILLAVLAVASIIGNGVLLFLPSAVAPPDLGVTVVFGTMSGPADLDPMDMWDSASSDLADQVCEALFTYNLTDPDLAIIPQLAKDFGKWNFTTVDGLPTYTIELRDDVWFHDGTKFDADAAVWNFDRYAGLMANHLAKAGELYEFYVRTDVVNETTGETAPVFHNIINKTVALDDYTIEFTLNTIYSAFEAVLSFNAAYFLSPASTPLDEPIDLATGDLVGTGPFVYDSFEPGVEVLFHANDFYYLPRAKIDTLIFSIINDAQIRNNALLSGDIDFLEDPMGSMLSTFDLDPDITLIEAGQTLGVQYLGMNNDWINITFRRAISHALNYSFIIEELLEGQAVRLESPVPEGIMYANWSYDEFQYDVAAARVIMQGMGFGLGWDTTAGGTSETEWAGASFATFNYTYNIGNQMRENMYPVLVDNLGKIGIKVTDAGTTWPQFILSLYELAGLHRNMTQLYWLGWIPDYNDASNYINPLFTNRSVASNGAKYNAYDAAVDNGRDPLLLMDNVQLLMEAALLETIPATRQLYYNRIQELLVEEDMPWAYGYVGINNDAWNKDLMGYPSNAMGRSYFYPVWWDIPALYEQ